MIGKIFICLTWVLSGIIRVPYSKYRITYIKVWASNYNPYIFVAVTTCTCHKLDAGYTCFVMEDRRRPLLCSISQESAQSVVELFLIWEKYTPSETTKPVGLRYWDGARWVFVTIHMCTSKTVVPIYSTKGEELGLLFAWVWMHFDRDNYTPVIIIITLCIINIVS